MDWDDVGVVLAYTIGLGAVCVAVPFFGVLGILAAGRLFGVL